jgi:hypothetical protein
MKKLFALLQGAAPDSGWFWSAFLSAGERVVECWGPAWTGRRVGGRPIGVWMLVGIWLSVPVALTAAVLP